MVKRNLSLNLEFRDPSMTTTTGLASSYHAHIYFDAESRDRARALRELISETFEGLGIGRFHEKHVGPHPRWSCQISFSLDMFAVIVPWLMVNRDGLIIFLHPVTDDDLADHKDFPLWMGEILPLGLDMFRK